MNRKEYDELRSALASTRMEGIEITAQTLEDCRRLLQGEISTVELVKEILMRPKEA